MLDVLREERELRRRLHRAPRCRRDFLPPTPERIGDLHLAEKLEHFLCARDRLARQAGEARDMDAVAPVGAPCHDPVQEHDLVVPLAHRSVSARVVSS